MYDPMMVKPMREELTRLGIEELLTPDKVTQFVKQPGTALVVLNSVCGCAAGQVRPGVTLAVGHATLPDRLGTVFAGNDRDAVQTLRALAPDFPPSSPCFFLFKDGKLEWFIPRQALEVRDAPAISTLLIEAFNKVCGQAA